MLDEGKTQRGFPDLQNLRSQKGGKNSKTPHGRIPQKDVKERNRGGKALLVSVAWRK
jgi:hypothetical protein